MQKLRAILKHIASCMIYCSGAFTARLKRLDKDLFLVLTYHRILPADMLRNYVQPGMYVDPVSFEMQIQFLKKYFDIRSIEEMSDFSWRSRKTGVSKHSCYLTFDDGWSDFYHHAFPILLKHRVPATVFLPTGFIGTTRRFWTERLCSMVSIVIKKNCFKDFRQFAISCLFLDNRMLSAGKEKFVEEIIKTLKNKNNDTINGFITSAESEFNIYQEENEINHLTWEQVSDLKSSGLVTFGSHTETHRLLTTLKQDEVQEELQASKKKLINRGVINGNRAIFCYPNGAYNDELIKQVDLSGYLCAFTTESGYNNSRTPPLTLKRISIHQDISYTKALFAYRIFKTGLSLKSQ